jgi:hypothetical protein
MQQDVNPASAESVKVYVSTPVVRAEHVESSLTRLVEQQTAKVPSHVFLFASLCAMTASLYFEARNQVRASRFVGMWVSPLLIMGVYNKLVKTFGPR